MIMEFFFSLFKIIKIIFFSNLITKIKINKNQTKSILIRKKGILVFFY